MRFQVFNLFKFNLTSALGNLCITLVRELLGLSLARWDLSVGYYYYYYSNEKRLWNVLAFNLKRAVKNCIWTTITRKAKREKKLFTFENCGKTLLELVHCGILKWCCTKAVFWFCMSSKWMMIAQSEWERVSIENENTPMSLYNLLELILINVTVIAKDKGYIFHNFYQNI